MQTPKIPIFPSKSNAVPIQSVALPPAATELIPWKHAPPHVCDFAESGRYTYGTSAGKMGLSHPAFQGHWTETDRSAIHDFLPARKRGTCYGDVAGWLAGCPSQPVLYQND